MFFFFFCRSQVCQERGWKEYEGTRNGDSVWSVPTDEYWNLWWKSTGFSLSHYKQQKIWQVWRAFLYLYMHKIVDSIFQSQCRVVFSANITAWIGCTKYTYFPIVTVFRRFIQWLKRVGTKSSFSLKVKLCVLFYISLQSPGGRLMLSVLVIITEVQ